MNKGIWGLRRPSPPPHLPAVTRLLILQSTSDLPVGPRPTFTSERGTLDPWLEHLLAPWYPAESHGRRRQPWVTPGGRKSKHLLGICLLSSPVKFLKFLAQPAKSSISWSPLLASPLPISMSSSQAGCQPQKPPVSTQTPGFPPLYSSQVQT